MEDIFVGEGCIFLGGCECACAFRINTFHATEIFIEKYEENSDIQRWGGQLVPVRDSHLRLGNDVPNRKAFIVMTVHKKNERILQGLKKKTKLMKGNL